MQDVLPMCQEEFGHVGVTCNHTVVMWLMVTYFDLRHFGETLPPVSAF